MTPMRVLHALTLVACVGLPAATARPEDPRPVFPRPPVAPIDPSLSAKTLDRWLAFLRPAPEECGWERIAWRPSFWDAVREAQETERPILCWAMNGHPLACT